jgi:hypothetical protein
MHASPPRKLQANAEVGGTGPLCSSVHEDPGWQTESTAGAAASSAQVFQMDPPPGTMAAKRSGTLLKLKFYITTISAGGVLESKNRSISSSLL